MGLWDGVVVGVVEWEEHVAEKVLHPTTWSRERARKNSIENAADLWVAAVLPTLCLLKYVRNLGNNWQCVFMTGSRPWRDNYVFVLETIIQRYQVLSEMQILHSNLQYNFIRVFYPYIYLFSDDISSRVNLWLSSHSTNYYNLQYLRPSELLLIKLHT